MARKRQEVCWLLGEHRVDAYVHKLELLTSLSPSHPHGSTPARTGAWEAKYQAEAVSREEELFKNLPREQRGHDDEVPVDKQQATAFGWCAHRCGHRPGGA